MPGLRLDIENLNKRIYPYETGLDIIRQIKTAKRKMLTEINEVQPAESMETPPDIQKTITIFDGASGLSTEKVGDLLECFIKHRVIFVKLTIFDLPEVRTLIDTCGGIDKVGLMISGYSNVGRWHTGPIKNYTFRNFQLMQRSELSDSFESYKYRHHG